MGHQLYIRLILAFVSITGVESYLRREVYEYTDCKFSHQERVGIEDGRIPDSAMTASTFNPRRQAKDGRVGHSSSAWTPAIQNAYQWLQIDLSKDFIVTAVYVQGRQGSDEYVREFFLEYSDDQLTWRKYTSQLGIPEIFIGNQNDSALVVRVLNYPVVARYIRFNPQRWNMVISMRVEISGCPFYPEVAVFDGESRIEYDRSQKSIPTEDDLLELRFRTGQPNGIILYASGSQGDLLMMELKRGYLYFKLNLGSTSTTSGMTEVKAGSLLDDNQWHEVIVTRNEHKLTVVVDRLISEEETNGLFYRLDLDKIFYVGGVPYFNQDGMTVKQNFIGCIGNINLNGARIIRDAFDDTVKSVTFTNNVHHNCQEFREIPVTFPTMESYLKVFGQPANSIQVSFDFRTHDEDALLLYHEMEPGQNVIVQIDKAGHITYSLTSLANEIVEDVIRNTDEVSTDNSDSFTDGLWHKFTLQISRDKINCTVDRNSKVSQRSLSIRSANDYFIGGHALFTGFRGCMRDIRVAQKQIDLEELRKSPDDKVIGAQIGTCDIRDRCTPNPCEHDGLCEQSWNTFVCNCDDTGYKGELCHTPAYHISCEIHKWYSNADGREEAMLDPDGSGRMPPYKASCVRNDDGEIITYIGHDTMGTTRVTGYQQPGSYVRKIKYAASDIYELDLIIDRARTCRQSVLYRCRGARFLSNPRLDDKRILSWGWWVGRTFQPMRYWGGAAPGSGKCKCGLEEKGCENQGTICSCDVVQREGEVEVHVDQGYLEHKEYLPVLEMHLGDTDSATDDKWSEYEIGELECFGDNLFDNTVTFTQANGALEFQTFEAENAGDIWFQFKTTTSDGVMIHCTGGEVADFIEIRLFQSDTIQFRYDVGNGVAVLAFKSPSPLNDDTWHTVHVEKNRKQAWMKIDDYTDVSRTEDADLIRPLDLSSPLTVGSTVGYHEGYVGCMRGLRVNGELRDMLRKLQNGEAFGVRAGCVGKCASNPCFNQGTCRERYDSYVCDCSYTPWRGWNCGREVGVNLKSNYMIRYTFDENQGLSASDFQFATIGFSTKVKQGILMYMRNEAGNEYISVEMNNNGGIKVVMDIGFSRVETNTKQELGVDYANSQVHVVTIRRSNFGRKMFFQVDNYTPAEEEYFEASKASDTILNNPKYLYIGNNDTSNTLRGFEGCIYRMQVDNIFPLKRAFQDPKPSYIDLFPEKTEDQDSPVREDMCGFEEITVSPEPIRTRPYSGVLLNVTYKRVTDPALSDEEKALVGVGCALFVILIACIVLFCCRNRLEGADYETEEAAGAEYADNPDSAVVYNQTGLPNMPKSFEYFM